MVVLAAACCCKMAERTARSLRLAGDIAFMAALGFDPRDVRLNGTPQQRAHLLSRPRRVYPNRGPASSVAAYGAVGAHVYPPTEVTVPEFTVPPTAHLPEFWGKIPDVM